MQTPVLFLIYNRPVLTIRVFERIRQARPAQLFIASDGPKDAKDEALVGQARAVIYAIDWECEIHVLFRNQNLGCGKAVSEAITWFFQHTPQGIILEDDCLVEPSFFGFCEALLDKYAYDEQVMLISAMSFLPTAPRTESYYFSQFAQIWGWASWRRAWEKMDFAMQGWDSFKEQQTIKSIAPRSKREQAFWLAYLEDYKNRNPNLWATRWWFSVWQARGIVATPYQNLVSNIGFGENGTNTQNSQSWYANLPTAPLPYPIAHPKNFSINHANDHLTYKIFFNPRENWLISWKNWLSKYLPLSLRLILKKIFRKQSK